MRRGRRQDDAAELHDDLQSAAEQGDHRRRRRWRREGQQGLRLQDDARVLHVKVLLLVVLLAVVLLRCVRVPHVAL
jgi:hypothetical protein